MSIFMSSKSAAEKISGLEARIEELEAEVVSIETFKAEAVTASETIASLTTERDELAGKIVAFEATIADQETTIAEANEKLATFDQEVETKIQLGIANLGFKGAIPTSSEESGNTISTREQINAIPDAKKRQAARLKNWDKL